MTCPSSHSNPRGKQHGGAAPKKPWLLGAGSLRPSPAAGPGLRLAGETSRRGGAGAAGSPARVGTGVSTGQGGDPDAEAVAVAARPAPSRPRARIGPTARRPAPRPPRARGPRLSATRRALLFVVINY